MSERPWYKRYPSDFIAGTAGWDLELKGAYSIFLDLFYDRAGSLPNDSRWFGRVAGCSTRRWGQLRDRLIELGKIVVTEDGKLSNKQPEKRMKREEKEAQAYRENGAKGGQKAAEKRLELFDNNDLAQNQVSGAKVWATPHFCLAPIRGHGFSGSCAAVARPFRAEPFRA